MFYTLVMFRLIDVSSNIPAMRYLIFILFFYSCRNHTNKPLAFSENKNITDSLLKNSNGARIEFHHPSKKLSIVARQIISRNQLDSLSTYIGSRSYDTSCSMAGLYNSYGQISLYRDTAMIDRINDIHFVLQNNCEGLYILTDQGLMRFDLTSAGKSSLLSLQREKSHFLNE